VLRVSVCLSVAIVIQHAMCMRRIIVPSVACLAVLYFSTFSHKRHDFRNRVIGRKICVFIFYTIFVSNMYHSKKNRTRYCRKCTKVFM